MRHQVNEDEAVQKTKVNFHTKKGS